MENIHCRKGLPSRISLLDLLKKVVCFLSHRISILLSSLTGVLMVYGCWLRVVASAGNIFLPVSHSKCISCEATLVQYLLWPATVGLLTHSNVLPLF